MTKAEREEKLKALEAAMMQVIRQVTPNVKRVHLTPAGEIFLREGLTFRRVKHQMKDLISHHISKLSAFGSSHA